MTSTARRIRTALTWGASAASVALTAQTVSNLRVLRVPEDDPRPVPERVSVLLPVRDEEDDVAACLATLLDQVGLPDLEVLVLDDGSTDGTARLVRAVAARDPRVRLLPGAPLPPGWTGKAHACAQLAAAAGGSVLVFVDADVRFSPHAVAAAVGTLRRSGLDLVSPCPRQLAESAGERLVQPLLHWLWLATLPLGPAEHSSRASLAAAVGQFLVVDAAAYARCGGHSAVRDRVMEDLALLRRLKSTGGRGVMVDGSRMARCRMYRDWDSLRDGYTKSLWSAAGGPAGSMAAAAGLATVAVVPPLAALGGSTVGLAGYAAAVVGRYLVAERTGGRSVPDALAHPASVALLAWLTARSCREHRAGRLVWKGRAL